MSKAKWLIVFLMALGLAVPSQAIELSLGGFPSFLRTRARYINGATYVNTLSDSQAQSLGLESNDDDIFFVDTTLRLTPQLVLSDSVTIRGQIDVLRNNVWGGIGTGVFGAGNGAGNGCIVGACTADDSFRGAILLGEKTFDLGSDNNNFFNVRMLHADIVLPHNLGFVRIGRQPFDWGMGIWANGGWDPASDLGFLPERFLWLKSFPVGNANLTQVLVSDIVSNNNFLFNGGGDIAQGNFGKTYDIIAGATILNMDIGGVNTTIGGFYFPFVQQANVASRLGLYSGLIDLKTDLWRFVYEIDFQEGELSGDLGLVGDQRDIDFQFEMAGRIEIYPSWPVKMIGIEGGWSQGDDSNEAGVQGNLVPFNPAYNIDQLLFKHIIPTLYNNEGSVQNAFYARAWTHVKLLDHLSWTPHVLAAWIHETDTNGGFNGVPLPDGTNTGLGTIVYEDLDRFLGIEVENTLTWTVHPGVNLDLIGSVVFAGDGLNDLQEQAGALAVGDSVDSATDVPWAVQTRLTIFIDQFLK